MTEIKCKNCGIKFGEETPQQNGMCIDCFADDWGELVELSPIVCHQDLLEEGDERTLSEEAKKLEISIWKKENGHKK